MWTPVLEVCPWDQCTCHYSMWDFGFCSVCCSQIACRFFNHKNILHVSEQDFWLAKFHLQYVQHWSCFSVITQVLCSIPTVAVLAQSLLQIFVVRFFVCFGGFGVGGLVSGVRNSAVASWHGWASQGSIHCTFQHLQKMWIIITHWHGHDGTFIVCSFAGCSWLSSSRGL